MTLKLSKAVPTRPEARPPSPGRRALPVRRRRRPRTRRRTRSRRSAVLDVLNAPVPPQAAISPARDYMLLVQGVRYPPITELAQPMLRLAGLRINPNTTGPHRATHYVSMSLKKIADGSERKVELPAGARVGVPVWSADGKRFAFTNTTGTGIELWAGEAASARAWRLKGVAVNAVAYGRTRIGVQWMPDNRTLLVQTVPASAARAPAEETVPKAPNIQESAGRPGPVRTYQDLLKDAHDEALFDFYATSQLAFVDAESGKATPLGRPAIFEEAEPSPDGAHLLVARLQRPYSYLHPADDFPKEVEVWDRRREGRLQGREPAARGRGAHRGRAEGAARLPLAADRSARRSSGPRRSTTATRARRFRTATAS